MKTYIDNKGTKVLVPSHVEDHLEAHIDVWKLLADAIAKTTLQKGFEMIEVDFGEVIGKSGALKTPRVEENQKTLWAKRVGRDTYSRVIIGEKEDCNTVMILAYKNEDETYTLITAFIGAEAEKEFTDPNLKEEEMEKSLNFWRENALVWEEGIFGEIVEASFEEARPEHYSELMKPIGWDRGDNDDNDVLYFEKISDRQKISLELSSYQEGIDSIYVHNPRFGHIEIIELEEFPEMEYFFNEALFEKEIKSIEKREVLFPNYENYDDFTVASNEVFECSYDGGDEYEPRGSHYVDERYFLINRK